MSLKNISKLYRTAAPNPIFQSALAGLYWGFSAGCLFTYYVLETL